MRPLREADRPVPSGYTLAFVEHYPGAGRRKPGEVRETYRGLDGSKFFRRRSSDGSRVIAESYFRDGELHRIEGPAEVRYETDGRVAREEWRVEGKRSRGDGAPALRVFVLGRLAREEWWVNGKPSRLDGPAESSIDRDGRVTERWMVQGKAVRSENVKLGLSWLSDEDARQEIRFSAYAVLLDEGACPMDVVSALAAGVRSLDGMREVVGGAPAEWVASYESGLVAA